MFVIFQASLFNWDLDERILATIVSLLLFVWHRNLLAWCFPSKNQGLGWLLFTPGRRCFNSDCTFPNGTLLLTFFSKKHPVPSVLLICFTALFFFLFFTSWLSNPRILRHKSLIFPYHYHFLKFVFWGPSYLGASQDFHGFDLYIFFFNSFASIFLPSFFFWYVQFVSKSKIESKLFVFPNK